MNQRITLLLTAFFILNILYVTSTNVDNLINVADINECYGMATLKVRSDNNIIKGEYEIVGCVEVDENKWNCRCNNLSNIVLKAGDNTTNVYNIIAEYYIAPLLKSNNTNVTPNKIDIENDLKRRTYEFNDIEVRPKEIIKEPVKLPKFNDGWRIGIITGGVIMGVLLLIAGVIVWLLKGEKENNY